jgi:NAD(P)-dependent dehydrogenase (short-subunit alcohol dehydrogenase family)
VSEEISFEGQVAVVTGGGGGIGRVQCLELAKRGASVVVNDVAGIGKPDGPLAEEVAAEIQAAGGNAVASLDSVGTPEGGQAIIDLAVDTFGTVDAVIHLAGTWRSKLFEELTPQDIDDVIDVHLLGGFYVVQPAYRIMKEKGYGRIVLCSSSTAMFGRRFGTNYSAGKGGLFGMARALGLEGAEHGIFTNALLPIASGVNKYRDMPPPEMMADYKQTGLARPLPEAANAERLVPLPTYLASSACTVNGEAFSGGGGRYGRVFVGVTDGYLSPKDVVATAEDIRDHLGEIEDQSRYVAPDSIFEELRYLAELIAKRDGTEQML